MKINAGKIRKKVIGYSMTLLFPVAMWLLFLIITAACGKADLFVSANGFDNIFRQSILPTFVALAIAIPLSGGRWDFATGTIAVLGAIIGGNIGLKISENVVVVLLSCIVTCVVLAMTVAALYIFLRVPNMIVSLGVVMLYEALSQIMFDGGGVKLNRYDGIISIIQAPWCYIVLALVLLCVYFFMEHTKFGYDTRSLGNNAMLAINSGVKEKKNIFFTYLLVGVLLGFAALFNASKANVNPASNLSSTSLMYSSMGPVLVGLFLAKFTCMPWGVWIGSIGMQVMTYGMVCTGIDGSIQMVVTGIVIVVIMAYTANQDLIVASAKKLVEKFKIGKRQSA